MNNQSRNYLIKSVVQSTVSLEFVSEVRHLEQVALALVVTKRVVLAPAAEPATEGVLEHSRGHSREILVYCVARYVSHFECVFLPP